MAWYQDDSLWQRFYACMFDEASFALAQQQIPQLLSLINTDVQSVLDLGCGPGRHCLPLAKMGFAVCGIDSSEYLLAIAKQKAKKLKLNINFIQADMRQCQLAPEVDLIVNMFNSFGYFKTPEQNQQLIVNAYNKLKPRGTLLIDTVGKETLARIMQPVHLSEYDNGDIRIERPLLIDNMQIFSNQWILIQGDKAYTYEYQHYVYTAVELSQMCQQAGFKSIHIYGSLLGEDYDLNSERLVVVAQK